MATTAVPAVLRDDRAVSAIDLVELGSGSTKFSAVDVLVSANEAPRIREKLLNSFAALYVEEIDEAPDEPTNRRTRIRSRSDRSG
jgi:hypothetical protein